jgi:hypothetical protein
MARPTASRRVREEESIWRNDMLAPERYQQ